MAWKPRDDLKGVPGYGEPLHYPALGMTIRPGDPGYDDLFVSRRMINPPPNQGGPAPWTPPPQSGPGPNPWTDWPLPPGNGELIPWHPGQPQPGQPGQPGLNPGGWPLYPPPPVTRPPGLGWEPGEGAMNPRSFPAWMFEQFPENYSYYDNLQKGLLDESWQLQRQAMQAFNQRQQEMSQLFNAQTAQLNATIADRTAKLDAALGRSEAGQQAGLAEMREGTGVYQKYLNEAMNLQNEALRSNPQKYQHYIDTGTLPPEIDAQLRGLRDQTLAATQVELDRQKAQANAALRQRTATMGMQDSEYAAIQNARLSGEAGRAMSQAIDSQNAQYVAQRLALPYQMQQAAIGTMQSYQPFIGNIMAGGAQQAQNYHNTGKANIDSSIALGSLHNQAFGNVTGAANQAYGNIMNAGHQQMQYPMQMFQMAGQLPQNAMLARQGYLDNMMKTWQILLGADITREGHQIQRDANEGSWWDTIFG